jgi:hypothetical protein
MEESTSGPADNEQEVVNEEIQETPALIQEVIEQGLEKPKKEPPQPKIEFIARKSQGYYHGHIRINGQVLRGVLGSGSSKKETKENLVKNWMANVQNTPTQAGVSVEDIEKAEIV